MVLVEATITSPVNLPSAIERDQNILQHACSKVDYIFGYGLYVAPYDLQLRMLDQQIEGCNDEFVIATKNPKLCVNADVNTAPTPPPVVTGEKGIVVPAEPAAAVPVIPAVLTFAPTVVPTVTSAQRAAAASHEDEKTALIVGGNCHWPLSPIVHALASLRWQCTPALQQ